MNILRSVRGETDAVTEALQLAVYIDELERQAEIGSRSLTRAWVRAMRPETEAQDPMVWGDLQACLFASIVITRILQPGQAFRHPAATKEERQARSKERSVQLRSLLQIDDSFPVFNVREIRNSFEHFDEGLDALVLAGRASLIDWHISRDGMSMRTPPGLDGPVLQALRVFHPTAGTLHFGDLTLDLFTLDCALLELRDERVPVARKELELTFAPGPKHFGASQYIHLVPPAQVEPRLAGWLRIREQIGHPIPFNLPSETHQRRAFPSGASSSPALDGS